MRDVKVVIFFFAAFVLHQVEASAQSAANPIYAINSSSREISLFNPATGVLSVQTTLPVGVTSSGIAYEKATGAVWFITSADRSIKKWTPLGGLVDTGLVLPIITTYQRAAFDKYGDLYILSDSQRLYRITPDILPLSYIDLGVVTGISGTGGDMVFGPNGLTYVVSNNGATRQLYTLNVSTLTGSLVGAIMTASNTTGVIFNNQNQLLVSTLGSIVYVVNPANGAILSSINTTAVSNDFGGPASYSDLSLSMTVEPESPVQGGSAKFFITLTNDGPDTAENIIVKDLLPAGLQYESDDADLGAYDPITGLWSIKTVPANSTKTFAIKVIVQGLGLITNVAEVMDTSSTDIDSTPGNNISSEDDQVSIAFNALVDSDGDGVADVNDNCPSVGNPLQENFDGDADGDVCDADDDNDGIIDSGDCDDFDNSIWRNRAYPDADSDTVRESGSLTVISCFGATPPTGYTLNLNGPDNCPGVANATQVDTDVDGQGDSCDSDDDDDGVLDGADCNSLDGKLWRNQAYLDGDSDGIRDGLSLTTVACFGNNPPLGSTLGTNGPDNCIGTANPDQKDTDSDSAGDACDNDDDNDGTADGADCDALSSAVWRDQAYVDADSDGIRDTAVLSGTACFGTTVPGGYTLTTNGPDNCPAISNSDQSNIDGDSQGDLCDSDDDNDNIDDGSDNCQTVSNNDQADNDHDGLGDSCDADDDNDGIPDSGDNCKVVSNADQLDTNNDGRGDACTDVGQCDPNNGGDCFYEDLAPSGCVGANGFLGQSNVVTVINISSQKLKTKVEYRDRFGKVKGSAQKVIAPFLKTDFIVNEIGLTADMYGTVCVSTDAKQAGAWTGGISLYKPNMRQAQSGFDFALNYPLMNPRTGIYSMPLNTFHLGTAKTAVVANWISIADGTPGDKKGLSGKLYYYNAQGKLVHTDTVSLSDGGRYDFSGHDALAGPKNVDAVGMATFVPTVKNNIQPKYYITNTRYFYDCVGASCPNFLTAFPMPYRPPTQNKMVGGVSTMNDELSIVELNNVAESAVSVNLNIYDPAGKKIGKQTVNVSPRATRHVIMNKVGNSGFLASSKVGSVEVSTPQGVISATTLFYKLNGTNVLQYGYAAPAVGSPGQAQVSEFNSFIGHVNRVEVYNSTNSQVTAELDLLNYTGAHISGQTFTLPPHGTKEFALNVGKDTYGTLIIQGEGVVFRNYVTSPGTYILPFLGR